MFEKRDIASCVEVAPSIRVRLIQKGYRSVEDVLSVAIHDLSEELELSVQEVASLVRLFETSRVPSGLSRSPIVYSAAELLEQEINSKGISTSSLEIDHLLGQGIPLNRITEFCGLPGVGKTQLAMQVTINSLKNSTKTSMDWVVYIDSEGGFSLERIVNMAKRNLPEVPLEDILKQIIYIRVVTKQELIAALYHTMDLIDKHPVGLVVIDSIAFLLRYDGVSSHQDRIRLSSHIEQLLTEILAKRDGLAMILTNHLVSNYSKTSDGRSSQFVPALGDVRFNVAHYRLSLSQKQARRVATLTKSSERQLSEAFFTITSDGIADEPPSVECLSKRD